MWYGTSLLRVCLTQLGYRFPNMLCLLSAFTSHLMLTRLVETHFLHLKGIQIQIYGTTANMTSLSIQIYSSFLKLNLKLVFSGKESAYQCKRHKGCRFDPWVGKIPWRRAWQLTPVFLPRESHGQRSLVGYSPLDHKQSDMTEVT